METSAPSSGLTAAEALASGLGRESKSLFLPWVNIKEPQAAYWEGPSGSFHSKITGCCGLSLSSVWLPALLKRIWISCQHSKIRCFFFFFFKYDFLNFFGKKSVLVEVCLYYCKGWHLEPSSHHPLDKHSLSSRPQSSPGLFHSLTLPYPCKHPTWCHFGMREPRPREKK